MFQKCLSLFFALFVFVFLSTCKSRESSRKASNEASNWKKSSVAAASPAPTAASTPKTAKPPAKASALPINNATASYNGNGSAMLSSKAAIVQYSALPPTASNDHNRVGIVFEKYDTQKHIQESIANQRDLYKPGQLTATEINDFQKWELWEDISEIDLLHCRSVWKMDAWQRYSVHLTNEEIQPLVDAEVELRTITGNVLWKAKTDNRGMAELWANFFEWDPDSERKLTLIARFQGKNTTLENPVLFQEGINFMTLAGDCTPPNSLDIAFVVDATGSMGDEIDYLKSDLMDVLTKTQDRHPDLTLRFGSLFYKCPDNDYLSQKMDFDTDLEKGLEFIKEKRADGGGEESVEVALLESVHLMDWSTEARSRLLFLVLDESPGTSDSVLSNYSLAIQHAAEKGIHIIPVVASGMGLETDRLLEYLMRTSALATNGTCAFLTDDSGIGNDHTEPVTDEIKVEILGELLGRLIDQYVEVQPCEAVAPVVAASDTVWVEVKNVSTKMQRTIDYLLEETEVQELADLELTRENDESLAGETTDSQKTASGFRFYPNPTTGPLTVEMKGDIREVFITDPTGKVILRLDGHEQSTVKTDLSRFAGGFYMVRYIQEDQIKGDRLILVH